MRFLAFLLFLFFLVFAIVARWYYVCEFKQLCGPEEPIEVVDDVRLKNLQLLNADSVVLLRGYDQFAFDSASYAPRLNANNALFLDTLADLLQADTTQNVTITGFHRESEIDLMPGFFKHFGVARADAIRQLLLDRGIAKDRMDLDYGISLDSTLAEPLTFRFYTAGLPQEFSKVAYTFEDMNFPDVNFAKDSDEFIPSKPFELYADSVKVYLSFNPDKSLRVIGHADSDFTKSYNHKLGLRRAKSVKAYLEGIGISGTIKVDSKGELEPIVPNTSEDNKRKNRRVNILIEEDDQ